MVGQVGTRLLPIVVEFSALVRQVAVSGGRPIPVSEACGQAGVVRGRPDDSASARPTLPSIPGPPALLQFRSSSERHDGLHALESFERTCCGSSKARVGPEHPMLRLGR